MEEIDLYLFLKTEYPQNAELHHKKWNQTAHWQQIDRTKYNVRYGSDTFFDNLGNRVIYNEFDLKVKLTF